jgi:hypothetical protein
MCSALLRLFFAEIKDAGHRQVAEYIFIGSMSSFGLALFIGWFARHLLVITRT